MSNNPQERSVDDIVNSILENVPEIGTNRVRLPSLGQIYGLDSEYVTIRGMTFDDEKALLAVKDKAQAIDLLISRCVEENINPRKLIAQDKIFIVVNIRSLSVGSNYDVSITCGNCSEVSKVSLDVLDVFKCNYPEAPVSQTVEIELPVSKKKVVVRRASSVELENPEKIYDNLWSFIESIEGIINGQVRLEVVKKLPLKDIHAIIRALNCDDIGLDTAFIFQCFECGHEEVTDLSLNQDFFMMR